MSWKSAFAIYLRPWRFTGIALSALCSWTRTRKSVCPNSFCRKDFTVCGSLTFFVEVPIIQQRFFAKTGFYNDIQHHHNRDHKCGQICDIYNGELYKGLSKHPNVLSRPQNLPFTWNTDGVPIFKSSNFSLWPLYLVINELPPKKRFSKDNMILAGLLFGY